MEQDPYQTGMVFSADRLNTIQAFQMSLSKGAEWVWSRNALERCKIYAERTDAESRRRNEELQERLRQKQLAIEDRERRRQEHERNLVQVLRSILNEHGALFLSQIVELLAASGYRHIHNNGYFTYLSGMLYHLANDGVLRRNGDGTYQLPGSEIVRQKPRNPPPEDSRLIGQIMMSREELDKMKLDREISQRQQMATLKDEILRLVACKGP
jgi:hypothetical protein